MRVKSLLSVHDTVMLLVLVLLVSDLLARGSSDGARYDYTAYTQCKLHSEAPLYNGGILSWNNSRMTHLTTDEAAYSPAFVLYNLSGATMYSFSCWVKIKGRKTAHIKAKISTDNGTSQCIGTALVRNRCWSFLKGGFTLNSNAQTTVLSFQSASQNTSTISIKSASLQPFSPEQWNQHRKDSIQLNRERFVNIHISDTEGNRIAGANISVHHISKEFPIGSAISKTILGNKSYQEWFVERFNAAVFENELKWYVTEPSPGRLNYSLADELLQFVQSNQITARGHNIFWEDPKYTPTWVKNLTGAQLRSAVASRIDSLLSRYQGDFVHWDVSNEMLHFDFYENRLGSNATVGFFGTAKRADPLATLFMNDFNVVETCDDLSSSVDSYVSRLKQLMQGGVEFEGIGLEGHFGKPNIPLMRAVLDKLGTLGLPVWLTEIDISNAFDHTTQAAYLEEVVREGFAHPAVDGIMLWTALHANGSCYQMCLTDQNFVNLPAGDVVDKLLGEWQTEGVQGTTNDHGSFNFSAFLGEYRLSVSYQHMTTESTFSLARSDDTKHVNIHLSL